MNTLEQFHESPKCPLDQRVLIPIRAVLDILVSRQVVVFCVEYGMNCMARKTSVIKGNEYT